MIYNVPANPGTFAAVPLSVALATSWAAGHRLWALLIAIWFSGSPLIYVALTELPDETADRVLSGVVSDMALMAAVLLLGEALRGRRALGREHGLLLVEQERSEALLLNIRPPRSPNGSGRARR